MTANDDGFSKLETYFDILLQCVLSANEEQIRAISLGTRAKMRKRSLSTLMNDVVTHNLREQLSGFPEIRLIEKYGQLKIVFSSDFLMKCKKSDDRERLSFIPTQLALGFVHQLGQMEFPDMPKKITNIVLTYRWDRTRTAIEKVMVLWPSGVNSYSRKFEIPFTPTFEATALAESESSVSLPLESKPVVPRQKGKKGTGKKSKKKSTKMPKKLQKDSEGTDGH